MLVYNSTQKLKIQGKCHHDIIIRKRKHKTIDTEKRNFQNEVCDINKSSFRYFKRQTKHCVLYPLILIGQPI